MRHQCVVCHSDLRPAVGQSGQVLQLVCGREEVAVGERGRDQRRDRDASEQRPEQHELQAHRVHRVCAGQQHPDHRAGEEDQPGRLRRVHERDHPRAQAGAHDRQRRLRGRGAERERRLDSRGRARMSSPRRLRATAAAVIALPTTIPPTGTRKRGSGSNTPSATTSTSVRPPAVAERDQQRPERSGHVARAVAGGQRAEHDHRRDQRDHEHDPVLLEDRVDHAARRRSAG